MQTVRRANYRVILAAVLGLLLTMVVASHRGGAQVPPSETLTFAPIAETYVQSSSPDGNYADDDRLRADADP
jgi:hypothetical protein